MPRQLIDHIANPDEAIKIEVLDEPGQGGANHLYRIFWHREHAKNTNREEWLVGFQDGPIKEFGVNGITHEALLAIVIDRLQSFQAGPFACTANQNALGYCRAALTALLDRTMERIARGVEGTNHF